MSCTQQVVEQRIARRRDQEAKAVDLRRRLAQSQILHGQATGEARAEGLRRARSEAAERRELYMDYEITRQMQEKAKLFQISQFEDRIADELAKRKAVQQREAMDRRRICDGSEELRQLKERLHMAKVNKERAHQLLEIQVRKERDRLIEHKFAENMANHVLEQAELEHKLVIEKDKQRQRVKSINQQQIAMKEAQRDEAMQEYQRERAEVDNLVAQIIDENERERKAKEEKQAESRQLLQNFLVEQQQRQIQKLAEEQEENERIEAYARMKRQQEEKLAAEKEERELEKKRLMNKMVGQMEAKSKEKEMLEYLCNELHFEELEAKSRRQEEQRARKILEDKEELKMACEVQQRAKDEKLAQARAEEEKLRAEMMQKFAEDDRLEQLNDHKRRLKLEAHKRETERLLQIRRETYEMARQKEREEMEALKKDEHQREAVIQAERKRIIEEHARELRNFLPPGTLQSSEDLKLVYGSDRAVEVAY
mmetsp:Transcript_88743/g.123161  ORF Transcript_88743/g.123161 Transcript_88743/m.123161 type:complete len:483 (-) Transcript_88743:197-1645(-)